MQSRNEVVCAGILVADHICTPMSALPDPGRLVAVDAMYLMTGGCAANVGVDIARQGVGVSVLGRVGNDYWGRFIREDLAAREVHTDQILLSDREQTSQTMILLCEGQDRRFVHTFGANREFRVEDIRPEALDGAKVLYLGGFLVLPSVDPEALGNLFRQCNERGIRTVLDVVIPEGFQYADELRPVLPHTDVFLPNNDEAEKLTGEIEPRRQAAALRQQGTKTVIITLGSDGLLFASDEGNGTARPFPTEVVDQTGAGDAFCGGFITGMVRGKDLLGCLEYGSALGAACVRAVGASEGVCTAAEAEAFLANHRLEVEPLR
jgi:sugar/nucleoside kinase (ribokinase family)